MARTCGRGIRREPVRMRVSFAQELSRPIGEDEDRGSGRRPGFDRQHLGGTYSARAAALHAQRTSWSVITHVCWCACGSILCEDRPRRTYIWASVST